MPRMLSKFSATLSLSEFPISEQSINEIDEALIHASRTRNDPAFTHRQREIVNKFIDDLLDSRSELTRC